jgi:predicted RNA binding protein YcfA (HicA-like mRNA interferase family)
MEPELPAEIRALRLRAGNLKPKDLQSIAEAAGFVYQHTSGSHAIYSKDGYWANLAIPLHSLKKKTALRILNLIDGAVQGGNDDE